MRQILLLIFCITTISVSAQSTETAVLEAMGKKVKPEKGDAQVVIQSNLSFIEVGKKLMMEGYGIDKIDTSLGYLNTIPKGIPGINGEYYLNIMKMGDQYKFVGMYRYNFTASLAGISSAKGAYEIARYRKAANGESRVFNAALKVATSFGGIVAIMK